MIYSHRQTLKDVAKELTMSGIVSAREQTDNAIAAEYIKKAKEQEIPTPTKAKSACLTSDSYGLCIHW
ncbi:MAG: hypothetical protein ACI80S_000329 [Pseudohongiellaceae bacterium]